MVFSHLLLTYDDEGTNRTSHVCNRDICLGNDEECILSSKGVGRCVGGSNEIRWKLG